MWFVGEVVVVVSRIAEVPSMGRSGLHGGAFSGLPEFLRMMSVACDP